MDKPTQFVTIMYFDEFKDDAQLRAYENFRDVFQQNWAHLLNEHGQWWGRELGKRERLWWIGFFKDETSSDTLYADPRFKDFELNFFRIVAPVKTRMTNVFVRGSIPMHKALEAGVTLLGYYRYVKDEHAAKLDEVCERVIAEFDYPGWHGLAYVPAAANGNESVACGAWDSVEASQQIGTGGRSADLLSELDQLYDNLEKTFLAHVKFQRHAS